MAASGRTWRVTAVEGCANIFAIFEKETITGKFFLPAKPIGRITSPALFDCAAIESPQESPRAIILITRKDFVFSDQTGVFFETRLK